MLKLAFTSLVHVVVTKAFEHRAETEASADSLAISMMAGLDAYKDSKVNVDELAHTFALAKHHAGLDVVTDESALLQVAVQRTQPVTGLERLETCMQEAIPGNISSVALALVQCKDILAASFEHSSEFAAFLASKAEFEVGAELGSPSGHSGDGDWVKPFTTLTFNVTCSGEDPLNQPAISCNSDDPLGVEYATHTFNGKVNCGTLMTSEGFSSPPTITFKHAIPKAFYTLMMMDPDCCGGLDHSGGVWGTSSCPPGGDHHPRCSDGLSPVLHWFVGNIPGSELQGGWFPRDTGESGAIAGTGNGTTVYPFGNLTMASGSHRYSWFLYQQPGDTAMTMTKIPMTEPERGYVTLSFDYMNFLGQYGMHYSDYVSSNYMIATAC